jgi:crossover junction endodeoxyribonuclease RuvC
MGMLTLGIDPGTRKLGWGVVESVGAKLRHVAHGVITLDADQPLAERLVVLASELSRVVTQHRPQVGSVESLFFAKDAQAAAKLGHARGVVLYCLAREQIPVAEYAPARVKRTIAGSGQAGKSQVAKVVQSLLRLASVPPADAADALAIAITHLRVAPVTLSLQTRPTPGRRLLEQLIKQRSASRRARALAPRAASRSPLG